MIKLLEILNEAIKKSHFDQRVFDRLKSEFTTFTQESPQIQTEVFNYVNFIEKINFPGQDNIGILVYKSAKWYKYEKMVEGKLEKSEGNYVWAIIRGNEMETIVFGDASYKPQNTQILVKLSNLIHFINEKKQGNFNLTDKDVQRLASYNPNQQTVEKEKEYVFNINGVKWVLSPDKNYLVKKNNPSDRITVDQAIETLPQEQGDILLDML